MRPATFLVATVASVAVTAAARQPAPAAGMIDGHVLTPSAGFVAGAAVTLTSLDAPGPSRTMSSGTNGEFSFAGLSAGRYRLTAVKPGFTFRQPGGLDIDSRGAARFREALDVVLGQYEQRQALELVMWPAGALAGRIIRTDGSAAPDVQVTAAVKEGRRLLRLPETVTVSAFDGRYEITGLPPGEYYVAAFPLKAPAPRPELHETWYPGVRDDSEAQSIRVLEGVRAEGIDLWLTPAQRFNVSGRVFWPVGVSADHISIDYGDPAGTTSGVWYVSDPGGLFTLTGIAPGPLVLLAHAESEQGWLMGVASTEVTVDAVEDIRIVIDRPGIVEGRVVYGIDVPMDQRASSVSLVQALFRVSPIYPAPESRIGRAGDFRLTNALGEYTFRLQPTVDDRVSVRVYRGDRLIESGRLRVGNGEHVTGIEIRVGRR